MLSRTTMRSTGFTLIEMMITMAVLALLLTFGLPGMNTWLQNTQIRSAAEGMASGLQSARAEALRRNDLVRFQLVDSLASGCALTTTGTSWVVTLGTDAATGACDATESDTGDGLKILQKRSGAEGSPNAVINASAQSVLFNGLGRVSADGAAMLIDITNASGKCQPDGPMRCLRLTVAPGGDVRMCDPVVMDATDPRRC